MIFNLKSVGFIAVEYFHNGVQVDPPPAFYCCLYFQSTPDYERSCTDVRTVDTYADKSGKL